MQDKWCQKQFSTEKWLRNPGVIYQFLVLVGDDYQLPGVAPEAFDAFEAPKGHRATDRGRQVFKECATIVVSLFTFKRIQEKQIADKQLLTKLRTATPLDDNEVK